MQVTSRGSCAALLTAGLASAVLIWWSWRARRKAEGDEAVQAVSVPKQPVSRRAEPGPTRGPIATAIHTKVSSALQPSELRIHDDSAAHRGHAGVAGAQIPETHFKVEVVSAAFEGIRKLERQRKVQDLLKEEFAAGLHALELTCRTPAEHAKVRERDWTHVKDGVMVTVDELRRQLAPTGVLRAGINLANFLLVTGQSARGAPEGVSPDLAAEIAKRLGTALRLVPFPNPKDLGDAVDEGCWDIALIGAEPQREEKIAFSKPYVEIPATYLVPSNSKLRSIEEVDSPTVRIACMGGTAFGLWLDKNICRASVIKVDSMDAALKLLVDGQADVLANLRERLLSDVLHVPGGRILEGHFMTVKQAVGTSKRRGTHAAAFLAETVEELKANGFVESLIAKHGVGGKLVVPIEGPETKRRRTDVASDGKGSIAILGCGAMGCVYAAFFARAGHEVWVVDVWPEHISKMREEGLRLQGPTGDFTVRVNATLSAYDVPRSDLVIIATKMRDLESAAQLAPKLTKEDGVILSIQNGLGAAERLLKHVDAGRGMLGIASNFGACMRGPGHAEHKSMNRIILGELGEKATERLQKVSCIWSSVGFNVEAASDIQQKIWEKLICNVFVGGTCAITDFKVGEMVDNPFAKQVAVACAKEAYEVGKSKGIKFGFEDLEEFVDKFASTVRDTYPSMAQDHRKRQTSEVDVINGAIPPEAAKQGLAAPVNDTVASLLREQGLGCDNMTLLVVELQPSQRSQMRQLWTFPHGSAVHRAGGKVTMTPSSRRRVVMQLQNVKRSSRAKVKNAGRSKMRSS
ncbi:unnamed protein product [Symbiodinium microadriaticum]|nr:unnamed protein product [Symbiodinium microadriaticum]